MKLRREDYSNSTARRNLSRLGALLYLLALLLPLVGFCQSPQVSELAPLFEGMTFSGQRVSISQYRGKIVYLDFWASWCPPCRKTLPWMNRISENYKSDDFVVLAVNLDSRAESAEKILSEVSPRYVIISDPSGEIAGTYSPPAMPTSYLIDRTGHIQSIFKGFRDGDDKLIEDKIKELIKKN